MMTRKLLRSFVSSSSSSINPLTKIKSFSIYRNNLGPFSSFYSTTTTTASPTLTPSSSSSSVPNDTLLRRLYGVVQKHSVNQVLQKWVDEGREVDVDNIRNIIKHFRNYRSYSRALQISEWMDSNERSNITSGDAAVHLDLIAKVHGQEQAEKYFESLPDELRVFQTFGALLNCYAKAKSLDKAEAIMQKMRQLGYKKTLCYNVMLTLYSQMGKLEKLESLVREMEAKGIRFDNYSYNIRLHAYVEASDIIGMDNLLMKMEADPFVVMEWNAYSIAANGYLKAGDFEKAKLVLKKAEMLIKSAKASGRGSKADEKEGHAYQVLITLYATMGRKDEVYRLWNLHKKPRKLYNTSYFCVISSLLKLEDLDGAEKMLNEWLANNVSFDIRTPNVVVTAFCNKGQMEKAESIISRLVDSGNKPNATTWSRMALGYYKANQMENAVEMTKKTITASSPGWKPDIQVLASCLEYLKEKGDAGGAEEIIGLLEERGKFSAEFKDRISRYIKGDLASKEVDQSEQESQILEEEFFEDTELNLENTSWKMH